MVMDMKDTYGEIVRCSRCKRRLIRKAGKKKNRKKEFIWDPEMGMAFCRECWIYENLERLEKASILGVREKFNAPPEEYEILDKKMDARLGQSRSYKRRKHAPIYFMYWDEKKDRMYCQNCHKLFCDYSRMGRSPIFLINCPHCLSKNTINATQRLKRLKNIQTSGYNQYTKDRKKLDDVIKKATKQVNL